MVTKFYVDPWFPVKRKYGDELLLKCDPNHALLNLRLEVTAGLPLERIQQNVLAAYKAQLIVFMASPKTGGLYGTLERRGGNMRLIKTSSDLWQKPENSCYWKKGSEKHFLVAYLTLQASDSMLGNITEHCNEENLDK
jgi:hypothetical protein